jgi:hypothetical protein
MLQNINVGVQREGWIHAKALANSYSTSNPQGLPTLLYEVSEVLSLATVSALGDIS